MEVAFDAENRVVARVALAIALARIEGVRPKLVELTLPTMELDRLGAQLERCAKDVLNEEKDNFDWVLELRLAMLVALLVYSMDLLGLQKKEVKLNVDPEQTLQRLAAVERLRDEMTGQGRLPLKDRPEIQALTEKVNEAAEKVRQAVNDAPANQLTIDGVTPATGPAADVAKKRRQVNGAKDRAVAKKAATKKGPAKRPDWQRGSKRGARR